MDIGERIRILREKKEMTQTELAQKISSTKQTVYKYENGIVTNIPYDKLMLLAETLGTTPAALMGWEDKKPDPPLTEEDEREIGHDLDRIMKKLENDADAPIFYNGEEIDDGSLEILRKALELGLSQLKRENDLNRSRKKKND